MKRLILLTALSLPLFATEQRFAACLSAPACANVSLVATATALTVQQPTPVAGTPGTAMQLESATVFCSAACTVSLSQNASTPATTTASTPKPIAPVLGTPSVNAFSASNASGGTVIPPVITLAAGLTYTFDLSKVTIPAGSTKANFTVSIASFTGDANITIIWKEVQ
jgi:hypothetical protein